MTLANISAPKVLTVSHPFLGKVCPVCHKSFELGDALVRAWDDGRKVIVHEGCAK